jgi:hypothetical protein
MCLLIRAFLPLILTCFAGHLQEAHAVKPDHPRTASVSGRVVIGDNPAVGVQVALVPETGNEGIRRAKTDQDGHYLLDSLASGYYTIHVVAPTLAVQARGSQGRRITLQEAVKLENIDFALVPGGVITGRVTDGDGSPIIDQFPTIKVVDEKGRTTNFTPCPQESETDDRGIYRIYGLPPGRYIIAFGVDWNGPRMDQNESVVVPRQLYPLTYYPGVLEEAGSKPVEVTAGGEITGIDIRLTVKRSLFKATGTVVDAPTGAPIVGAAVSHGLSTSWPGAYETVRSDSGGRIKLDRLQAGTHFLTLPNDYSQATNSFSDRVTFEISDGDVDGLQVRVHHGLAISGVVVSAGANDEGNSTALANCEVHAMQLGTTPNNVIPNWNYAAGARIAVGSFRLAGLSPGKYRLQLSNDGEDSLYISYIDVPGIGRLMNRALYPPGSFDGDPIEIGEGQNTQDIQGVQIVIGRPHGVIRGQLKFEGGSLPQGAVIEVSIAMLPAPETRPYAGASVDPDGRFVIPSLVAGQYVIRAAAYINPSIPQKGAGIKVLARASDTVTVTDGQETSLTLTLNLGGGQPQ